MVLFDVCCIISYANIPYDLLVSLAAVNGDANRLDIYRRQSVNAFTSIRSRAFIIFATKNQSITELSYQVGHIHSSWSTIIPQDLIYILASIFSLRTVARVWLCRLHHCILTIFTSQYSQYSIHIDQLEEYCSCSFILFLHFRWFDVI